MTDSQNSERLIGMFGDELAYCPQMKCWYIWGGRKWMEDESEQLLQYAKKVARSWRGDAGKYETAHSLHRKLTRWAEVSENVQRMRAMIDIAKSEDGVSAPIKQFDHDCMRLNVLNGTIDLNKRRLYKFDPDDYITNIAPVTYTRRAKNTTWLAFLKTVIPDPDTRNFIQCAAGYSLTGLMDEHKIFMLHGGGCNGKSTFTGALLNMLGDYGSQASSNTLIKKRSTSSPSNDLFVLAGKRFVSASEIDEAHYLDEVLVKQMTGGERVSVNPKYRSQMEIQPTWKIWLSTNHEPVIKGNDDGIWRRLIKIPFTVRIDKPDPKLQWKLFNDVEGRSGILNWALEGLYIWQQTKLVIPKGVRQAIDHYRADQDITGQFIQDVCQIHPQLSIETKQLYEAYKDYCKAISEKPKRMPDYEKQISGFGISTRRVKNKRTWFGIGIVRPVKLFPLDVE